LWLQAFCRGKSAISRYKINSCFRPSLLGYRSISSIK
jgi:hypothetical protein